MCDAWVHLVHACMHVFTHRIVILVLGSWIAHVVSPQNHFRGDRRATLISIFVVGKARDAVSIDSVG